MRWIEQEENEWVKGPLKWRKAGQGQPSKAEAGQQQKALGQEQSVPKKLSKSEPCL